jgi:hypothetical protein
VAYERTVKTRSGRSRCRWCGRLGGVLEVSSTWGQPTTSRRVGVGGVQGRGARQRLVQGQASLLYVRVVGPEIPTNFAVRQSCYWVVTAHANSGLRRLARPPASAT